MSKKNETDESSVVEAVTKNFIDFVKNNLSTAINAYKEDGDESYEEFRKQYSDKDLLKPSNWQPHHFDPENNEIMLVFDDGRLFSYVEYNNDFTLVDPIELNLD